MISDRGVLLAPAQLGDLHRSLRGQWVLSVYLAHPATNPADRRLSRRQLRDQLDAIERGIPAADAAQRDAYTACVAHLGAAVTPDDGEVGLFTTSWAAFVTAAGIRFAGDVPAPMPTVAHWGRGPLVAPYVRALKQWRPITVAMVNSVSARLYRYVGGALTSRQRFDVHVAGGDPDRLGSPGRPGFHRGTRGITAVDQASQGRVEARDHIAHEVAQQVMRGDGGARLILGGNEATIHAVLRNLPKAVADKALLLPGVEMHAPDSVLSELVANGASLLRDNEDLQLIAEVAEAVGAHGRGAAGRDAVNAAVRDGRAQRLLLTLRFMEGEPDVAEEIIEGALAHAVEIEVVSGHAAEQLEREGGGVMALLRFVTMPAAEFAEVI